ncbi:ABC transporter permease [Undibacterium sp. TS12]|uniref:ABC transporter permease n=1 Tax=Undibacterium sp. TS12 TaxID=2908202 RepID=UPI001F4CD78B|nr:ABC transporter permease [Undibacterium sp. TS12]MCH8620533.1 ABC transporter permease [Undibacterium sp. TS12]
MSTKREENPWGRFASNFCASRLAIVSLVVLVALIVSALCAQWITPQNPYDLTQINIMSSTLEPGTPDPGGHYRFVLGSDDQGRDILSAIIYGLRISLGVGIVATLGALVIGLFLGLLAGYVGGWVDSFIMRLVDFQLSFPAVLIALILLSLLGSGIDKVIFALIAVQWAVYARTVRSAALVERSKEYVEAAVCLGLSGWRIVTRHLLPNCLPSLMVIAAVNVGHAIALEATLSFLGLGVPVTEPSLGMLIANGQQHMLAGAFWISLFPGLALLLTVISINLVADQLRDVLNPRLQR